MKKTNIQIHYDEDKFVTLQIYLKQKGISLDDELQRCLDSLFKKHVPIGVRKYFALRNEELLTPANKTKGD